MFDVVVEVDEPVPDEVEPVPPVPPVPEEDGVLVLLSVEEPDMLPEVLGVVVEEVVELGDDMSVLVEVDGVVVVVVVLVVELGVELVPELL